MTVPLLRPKAPESTKILYLARFAPDDPVYEVKPDIVPSGYSQYHFNIYRALTEIGYQVRSSSKPYTASMAGGNVDLVFSLLNRMPIRNPEIHVASLCAYQRLPILGAPPNIRALAEDKFMSKLSFRGLGLPVAEGAPCYLGETLVEPDFAGPYFVKDRFGAASEGIQADSLQDEWAGAARIAARLKAAGRDPMVERYCPGIDVTVPVIAHAPYLVLGHISPCSDQRGNILTEGLKADDHLGNAFADLDDTTTQAIAGDVAVLWAALGPIDYFRVDYRIDPRTGSRTILEINICCYLGEHGALCMAARRWGFSRRDVLAHVVEYSLARQTDEARRFKWIC